MIRKEKNVKIGKSNLKQRKRRKFYAAKKENKKQICKAI